MNCKKCNYHKIGLLGEVDYQGDPYKHFCELNGFKSTDSTNKNGASYSSESLVYYSDNQFDSFNIDKKNKVCWRKVFKRNIISLVLASLAILISCYSAFFKEDDKFIKIYENQIKSSIQATLDSMKIESRIKNVESNSSKIETINSLQDSILARNIQRLDEIEKKIE